MADSKAQSALASTTSRAMAPTGQESEPWWHRLRVPLLGLPILVILMVVLALAIAMLENTAAIALVVGMGTAVLIFVRIDIGLWLLALSVPFSSVRPLDIGGLNLTATDFLVGLLFLSWLARSLAHREVKIPHRGMLIVMGSFFAILLVTTTTAISLDATYKELLRWLEVILVYWVACTHLKTRRQIYILVSFLLIAASAESLVGFYQFFAKVGPESFAIGSFVRAYGTFSQPNPFAGYLGLVLPIAICLAVAALVAIQYSQKKHMSGQPVSQSLTIQYAISEKSGLLTDQKWRTITYVLAWAACGLIGGAILMSISRGALLGAVAALGVIAMLANRRTLGIAVVGIVVLAIILLLGAFSVLPAQISDRLTQMVQYFGVFDARHVAINSSNWAIVERMARWQSAWDMFIDYPLFGVGIGNYVVAYKWYALPGWPEALGHAHNFYLNMLAEAGVIGGVAYIGMVGYWFKHGVSVIQRVKRGGDLFNLAVALGLIGVITAGAVHNLFDNLYVHDMNVHIGLILGLLSALGALATSNESRGSEGLLKN